MQPSFPPSDRHFRESYFEGLATGLETGGEPVMLLDRLGRILYWNSKAAWQTGWSRAEVLGKPVTDLIFPESTWNAIQPWFGREELSALEPAEFPIELQVRRKRQGDFQAISFLTRIGEGDDALFAITFGDLTSRKRMEKYVSRLTLETRLLHQATTLASESESFEEALRHCVDIICEVTNWDVGFIYQVDETDRKLKPTTAALPFERNSNIRALGERCEFEMGQGLPGLAWKTSEPKWHTDLEQDETLPQEAVRSLNFAGSFCYPVKSRERTIAVLEFFSRESVEPDPQLLLMVRNLSIQLARVMERRRSQEQDARLAAIVDSSYDAIIGRDLHGKIISWNQGAQRIYGYSAEETIGKEITLIIPDGLQEEEEIRNAVDRGRRVEQFTVVRRRKDGTFIDISLTVSPVSGPTGEVVGISTIERDISEQSRINRELRLAKETAETANQAKNEFLANVSHELRTPMNAIIGMTDLSLSEELPLRIRNNLTTARTAAETLLYLLNDLLDFSTMETGNFVLDEKPFSLHRVIDDLLRLLAMRANEKGLELVYVIAPEVPEYLVGDGQRLRQILVNLLSNAIKFTERGEVVLEISQVRNPATDRTVDERESVGLQFEIRDTGVGISTTDRERIFAAFTQADATSTRQHSGTGLGLAICRQLVNLMHGRLWVESREGEGSSFFVDVDLATHAVSQAPRTTWNVDRLRDLPVLVVDDNPSCCTVLDNLLSEFGANVTAVGDAKSARHAIDARPAEDPFMLAVLDTQMPGEDGISLLQSLRRNQPTSLTTILTLFPDDRALIDDRLDGVQPDAFLEKPVSRGSLLRSIFFALDKETPAKRVFHADLRTGEPLQILVAEDTPANQKVVEAILTRLGHSVVLTDNGREALEALRRESFDLVLMDVAMPTMDGVQATRAIRKLQNPSTARVPIIAMTAHARPEDRERCLSAGMDGYLAKPFDLAELAELINRHSPIHLPGRNDLESKPRTTQDSMMETSKTDTALYDRTIAVSRLGSDDLFDDLVGFYLEDAPRMLATIRSAIDNERGEEGSRTAHSLKSMVASFEAVSARDICQRMEDVLSVPNYRAADELFPTLKQRIQDLMDALR